MPTGKLLKPIPLVYRKPRPRPRVRTTAPVTTGPTLVAAEYVVGQMLLTFDRAVDVSAFDGSQISVADGPNGFKYLGNSASAIDEVSVVVNLASDGSASGPDVLLNATGATGIVAVDGIASWAGVADVELPFP